MINILIKSDMHWLSVKYAILNALLKRIIFHFILNLPGHGSFPHSWVRSVSPSHSLPPCAGAGFVQDLVDFCVPPPQLTEHVP